MFSIEQSQIFFRDRFVSYTDATISVMNTSFLYGLGVFTGMRVHKNDETGELFVFRLREHYRRLVKSCKLMKFESFVKEFDEDAFVAAVLELITQNNIDEDVYIRATVFVDETKIGPKLSGYKDSLILFLYPLKNYVSLDGLKCCISTWRRLPDNSIPPRAKAVGAYVNTALVKDEAIQKGYDEGILLDEAGHAVEGSAENLFIVRDGIIYTPGFASDVLEGITRDSVITFARDLGYEVVEREIDRTELYTSDEVFLTGTAAKVSPVIHIDTTDIGDGKVGPVAKQLQEVFFRTCRGQEQKYHHWLTKVG